MREGIGIEGETWDVRRSVGVRVGTYDVSRITYDREKPPACRHFSLRTSHRSLLTPYFPAMKLLLPFAALAMFTASTLAADGPIRHVVHFKFKADAEKAKVEKVVEEFAALEKKIDEIEEFEWGTNVSPEGLDKGFTHCWVVTFKNAKDRDAYLVHPAHKAFVEILKPVLAEALVVDFVPRK